MTDPGQITRSPTADEAAGMAWWNALSERARGLWLHHAGSASPSDAWALFNANQGLEFSIRLQAAGTPPGRKAGAVDAYRFHSGVQLEDAHHQLLVTPNYDGLLRMRVVAKDSASGLSMSATVTGDDLMGLPFGLGHIKVNGGWIECFSPNQSCPTFLTGFKLLADPALGQLLQEWLPALAKTATFAAAMARSVERRAGKHVYHLHSFAEELAARVILDEHTPADALAYVKESHWMGRATDPDSLAYLALVDQDEIQALLETAAFRGS